MAYGIILFDLENSEDLHAYQVSQAGQGLAGILWDIDLHLRIEIEQGTHLPITIQELQRVRDLLHELLEIEGLNLNHVAR